ncbi:DUF3598 family protein [Microcoleus asticus]|uniref:DUF3598 domain-containing protein n=1 Tax=Microcoleus asticus IPMA8 TaxID=2563858 RepID=A0ABX2CXB2_9CYAN|nr:DUF3598 family protein [Microcoleus asticus]NQE35054.1 hypothetical protein [Microcoleus asticus IPMA8]
MVSQWENFLQNLGEWHGSFTKLSPRGEVLQDTPSIISLEGLNNNKTVRLKLRRFSPNPSGVGEPEVSELVREYQSLGRDILFFENGAFCQGTIQLAPYCECGAEFGFIYNYRRLRFVQLYNTDGNLSNLTLIREKQLDKNVPERPPLTVDDLLGEWQGEAVTIYPDYRHPDSYSTNLQLHLESGDRLVNKITFGSNATVITSSASIDGSVLHFNEGASPVKVVLLSDGGSCTLPLKIELRKPIFFEAGWLVEPDLRFRMIRSYNERGEWVSLTLIKERKISH